MQEAHKEKPQYNVILMQPEGYHHAAAFSETIEMLLHVLFALKLSFRFYINEIDKEVPSIILGAHQLDAPSMRDLPANAIIYNTEQFDEASEWISDDYLQMLKTHEVWDFSADNVLRLKAMGAARVKHAPLAYMPQLTRIPKRQEEKIDVLFYGSLNERRKKILEGLILKGLHVKHVYGVYLEARDLLISEAKVVLNMHFYEKSVFESVRVSWLLANEKAVICECSPEEVLPFPYLDAVCAVPYESLIDACCELVGNAEKRKALEKRGLALFSAYDAQPIFQKLLFAPQNVPVQALSPLPKILHIGSGRAFKIDAFNIDINEETRPDAVADLAHPALLETPFDTIRFGRVTLFENSFHELIAFDVLEHIRDLKTAMTNALRLLKPGGLFRITVPYDLSHGAWQDPTHVRAFNENSWYYYEARTAVPYLGWQEAAFDLYEFFYIHTKLGSNLLAEGKTLEEILLIPRSISHLKVSLRKRYLQTSEKTVPGFTRPWDEPDV